MFNSTHDLPQSAVSLQCRLAGDARPLHISAKAARLAQAALFLAIVPSLCTAQTSWTQLSKKDASIS